MGPGTLPKTICSEHSLFAKNCILVLFRFYSVPTFSESGLYVHLRYSIMDISVKNFSFSQKYWFSQINSGHFYYFILLTGVKRKEIGMSYMMQPCESIHLSVFCIIW